MTDTDIAALVERLRDMNEQLQKPAIRAAADALEALQEKLEIALHTVDENYGRAIDAEARAEKAEAALELMCHEVEQGLDPSDSVHGAKGYKTGVSILAARDRALAGDKP